MHACEEEIIKSKNIHTQRQQMRWWVFAAFVPLFFCGAAVVAENRKFQTLLFYTCVTPQVGNQCEEGFTLDQAGIVTRGFSSNFTTIERGWAQNITTFYAVHDVFFSNGKGLRKDWEQAWEALQAKIDPFIRKGAIVGFFVGDELFPGKITFEEFTTALKAIQETKVKYADYNLLTWENEGGTGWIADFKGGIPTELDIISMDDYYMWDDKTHGPQSQVDGHRNWYVKNVYPLLKSHQTVFIVPGSFGTHDPSPPKKGYPFGNKTYCYNGTFEGCDAYMADQANAYAQWAFEDQRVSGIAAWHWDTRKIGVVTPYKEIGVVDMKLTKDAWRAIGDKIKESGTADS